MAAASYTLREAMSSAVHVQVSRSNLPASTILPVILVCHTFCHLQWLRQTAHGFGLLSKEFAYEQVPSFVRWYRGFPDRLLTSARCRPFPSLRQKQQDNWNVATSGLVRFHAIDVSSPQLCSSFPSFPLTSQQQHHSTIINNSLVSILAFNRTIKYQSTSYYLFFYFKSIHQYVFLSLRSYCPRRRHFCFSSTVHQSSSSSTHRSKSNDTFRSNYNLNYP